MALLGAHHILHVSGLRVKNEWSHISTPLPPKIDGVDIDFFETGGNLHLPLRFKHLIFLGE
jgi:hypothetical protein